MDTDQLANEFTSPHHENSCSEGLIRMAENIGEVQLEPTVIHYSNYNQGIKSPIVEEFQN